MTETASQRAERRRRAAEVAVLRFDDLDDVRLMLHRRKAKLAASARRTNAEEGQRIARARWAEAHGVTIAEHDRLLEQLAPCFAGGATR